MTIDSKIAELAVLLGDAFQSYEQTAQTLADEAQVSANQADADAAAALADRLAAEAALNDAILAAGAADVAADDAEAAAAITLAAGNFTVSDLPTLLSSTTAYLVGSILTTRAEGYSYEVVTTGEHRTTAGGVKLSVSTSNMTITPEMFGAAGDGIADDKVAIQTCWDFGGANRIPVFMQGLEYNCSGTITTCSNLHVEGDGAVMYVTQWPMPIGGFINNVTADPAKRAQSNIRIRNLITDGSKLPAPQVGDNANLGPEFARGASDVVIENCTARYIREGTGGGTGGGGFGGEVGLKDVHFINCVAHDCYRGYRVAAKSGVNASDGSTRECVNVTFTNCAAYRCGTAIFAHAVGEGGVYDQSDLSIFDVVFDGFYAENCGHQGWMYLDSVTYPTIPTQKSGVFTFGGASNILMRGLRVKLHGSYPAGFTDYLGRTGYPAAGTGYLGSGLSGPVGALFWGWGRNIVVQDVTLDGSVDTYWKCARAIAMGDLATVAPTTGTNGVQQNVFDNIRHVRPGIYGTVFDGQAGLDNASISGRITVVPTSNPTVGVVGSAGTAGITNVHIRFVSNVGGVQEGSAAEWLADGNVRPSGATILHLKGGIDLGGGYSASGAKKGRSFDPSSGILRSSHDIATTAFHQAFYNTNGLVGGITTNGSATTYNTSSDARLKDDPQDFDGLGMVNAMRAYDHAWMTGGRGYGVFAQEAVEVVPYAVSIGDDDDDWNAKAVGERVPWSVDYSKLVPILIRAVQQLTAEIEALKA